MESQNILRNLISRFPKKEIKKVRLCHVTEQPELTSVNLREWKYSKYVNSDLSILADKIHNITQGKANRMNRSEKFEVCGLNAKGDNVATIAIKQNPERMEPSRESSLEALIPSLMRFVERGYDKLDGVLIRQAGTQKDLIDSYDKKVSSLEKSEAVLSEVVKGYREIHEEKDRKQRREDQFVKVLGTFAEYLAPTMAEKIFTTDRAPQKKADKKDTESKEAEKKPTNKTDKPKPR